jgi:hypothetical protein
MCRYPSDTIIEKDTPLKAGFSIRTCVIVIVFLLRCCRIFISTDAASKQRKSLSHESYGVTDDSTCEGGGLSLASYYVPYSRHAGEAGKVWR